jgi:hypothetical protein
MTVQTAPPSSFKLSEDWLATITGLIIALVIGLGLFGPGAQSVALTAKAGTNASRGINPLGGWSVTATVDGKRVSVTGAPNRLEAGKTYVFTCKDGAILGALAETLPEGSAIPPANQAGIFLVNSCSADATLTYTMNAVVPYPLFRLF